MYMGWYFPRSQNFDFPPLSYGAQFTFQVYQMRGSHFWYHLEVCLTQFYSMLHLKYTRYTTLTTQIHGRLFHFPRIPIL